MQSVATLFATITFLISSYWPLNSATQQILHQWAKRLPRAPWIEKKRWSILFPDHWRNANPIGELCLMVTILARNAQSID